MHFLLLRNLRIVFESAAAAPKLLQAKANDILATDIVTAVSAS
jgi:hypothetical protein